VSARDPASEDRAERLLDAARASLPNAVAPYSGLRVAAALEDATGAVHPGVNVESASFGLTLCAERNAVFGALARGARDFRRLAVVSNAKTPILPCGACRQVLYERAPDLIVIVPRDGGYEEIPITDLLPRPFRDFEPSR
jgi:cytidine deaminase